MKGRTVITIAHRLSTIRHADKIIVLKGGVVAEQGTHDELLGLGGVYAELYHAQVQPASPIGAPG
jgi:ABC-type multidrug transport system fused ATPase/permease subunit